MQIILLNWKGGENDPFTVFNRGLADGFESLGKRAKILELSDPNWISKLIDASFEGIEFALALQGIGSGTSVGKPGRNLWEALRIPLICLHGDHPCHMPANHALEVRNCAHLYWMAEFAHYSNQHFRKQTAASAIDMPLFFSEQRLGSVSGDYFVLAKNITAPPEMEEEWKRRLDGRAAKVMLAVAAVLREKLAQEPVLDFHAVIDEMIASQGYQEFDLAANPKAHHVLHSSLDLYVRNTKSVMLLEALQDVPIHIHGKGWQRYEKDASPCHRFFTPKNMAESQPLYYSRYGILDVTPARTGLHDRTLRAMQNETGFVSSAFLPGLLPDMDRFQSLFYQFCGSDLREKCEAVMTQPDAHAERAREFSRRYQARVPLSEFVWKLDLIARTLRAA